MSKQKTIYKYQCNTNREKDGLFRQECSLCNCAHFSKMILDPGKLLTNEQSDPRCPHTNELLTLISSWEEEESKPVIMGFKMSNTAIKKDRMERSNNHFKKEIFETLPKEDQKLLKHKS
jgi:hypothetical protein